MQKLCFSLLLVLVVVLFIIDHSTTTATVTSSAVAANIRQLRHEERKKTTSTTTTIEQTLHLSRHCFLALLKHESLLFAFRSHLKNHVLLDEHVHVVSRSNSNTSKPMINGRQFLIDHSKQAVATSCHEELSAAGEFGAIFIEQFYDRKLSFADSLLAKELSKLQALSYNELIDREYVDEATSEADEATNMAENVETDQESSSTAENNKRAKQQEKVQHSLRDNKSLLTIFSMNSVCQFQFIQDVFNLNSLNQSFIVSLEKTGTKADVNDDIVSVPIMPTVDKNNDTMSMSSRNHTTSAATLTTINLRDIYKGLVKEFWSSNRTSCSLHRKSMNEIFVTLERLQAARSDAHDTYLQAFFATFGSSFSVQVKKTLVVFEEEKKEEVTVVEQGTQTEDVQSSVAEKSEQQQTTQVEISKNDTLLLAVAKEDENKQIDENTAEQPVGILLMIETVFFTLIQTQILNSVFLMVYSMILLLLISMTHALRSKFGEMFIGGSLGKALASEWRQLLFSFFGSLVYAIVLQLSGSTALLATTHLILAFTCLGTIGLLLDLSTKK